MKKLIVVLLLAVGMTAFAQEKPSQDRSRMEKLSPEQRNELRLKKMTLELDLNDSQKKEMGQLIADQSKKMEAAKAERMAKKAAAQKVSNDEHFAKQTKMLDEQIATKQKVKKILTPEQYAKWEKMNDHKKHEMKSRMGKRKAGKERR